jgi:hypothetical protein
LLPDVFIVFDWLPENRSGLPNGIRSKEDVRGSLGSNLHNRGNVGNKGRLESRADTGREKK